MPGEADDDVWDTRPSAFVPFQTVIDSLNAEKGVDVEDPDTKMVLQGIGRESNPRYRRLRSRADSVTARRLITEEIVNRRGAVQLVKSYRSLLDSEARDHPVNAWTLPVSKEWPTGLDTGVRRAVRWIDVEFVDSLGPEVSLAVLRGPTRTRLIAGLDSGFVEMNEFTYQAIRLLLYSFRLFEVKQFGAVFDYKRDIESEVLKNETYRDDLAEAGLEAGAFLYPERYLDEDVRVRIHHRIVTGGLRKVPEARRGDIAHIASRVRHLLLRGLAREQHPSVRLLLGSVQKGGAPVTGRIAVARTDWWDRPYLLWADNSGNRGRRWIANKTVLRALDLPIQRVKPADLVRFPFHGILLEPELVDTLVRSRSQKQTDLTVDELLAIRPTEAIVSERVVIDEEEVMVVEPGAYDPDSN